MKPLIEVKFKKLQDEAVVPVQATENAANFDFVCTRIEKRAENKYTLFFGLAVEFPHGYKMVIVPRSSITGTDAIQQNSPGQVDSDYRGELQLRITTLSKGISDDLLDFLETRNRKYPDVELEYHDCPFKVGERVAQGYLEEVIPVRFVQADRLSETIRGTGGFGSTGKQNIQQELEILKYESQRA